MEMKEEEDLGGEMDVVVIVIEEDAEYCCRRSEDNS